MSAVQARQIANAVSVLEKFAKKGMVGNTTSMDAKRKASKKPASKGKKTGAGKTKKTASKKKGSKK